jgi:hypothetical protein
LTSRVTWQNRLRLSNKWMPCVSVWDANKGSSVQIKYHPYK